jgi:L-amino acid N-acyltransferase YncA
VAGLLDGRAELRAARSTVRSSPADHGRFGHVSIGLGLHPGENQGMRGTVHVRAAQASDAAVVAAVYNQGIAEREATFETEPRRAGDFLARVASGRCPLLVAELDGQVVGWAGLAPYSERATYAGIGEASVYVARSARGRGVGTELCRRLAEEAQRRGFWKLLGKVFPENTASVRMVRRCGFREVGLHRCHGRLDGRWRDVLLVERLLGDAHRAAAGEEQIPQVQSAEDSPV